MTLETQAAFARRIGRARSWITQLKEAGRLVMDGAGKMVEVEASLERIYATENPARGGVADRHEEARRAKGIAPTAGDGNPPPAGGIAEKTGIQFKYWQAVKMKADAESAKMDLARKAGDLVPREAAEFAIDDLGAGVRASLENVPDRWAPILAPMATLEAVRAALVEMVEAELNSLAERADRRARELRAGDAGAANE